MKTRLSVLALSVLAWSAPAVADMGFYGWGPRIGVGEDPDQFLVGVHQDLGEFVEDLRFQPSLDLGFGDDHTVASLALPVHYRFALETATPYLGGGLLLQWIDFDPPRGRGGSDFDITGLLAGGVEWGVAGAGDIFLEIQIPGGDAHDVKVAFGWMLRAR
jgi:hypothetical protein